MARGAMDDARDDSIDVLFGAAHDVGAQQERSSRPRKRPLFYAYFFSDMSVSGEEK